MSIAVCLSNVSYQLEWRPFFVFSFSFFSSFIYNWNCLLPDTLYAYFTIPIHAYIHMYVYWSIHYYFKQSVWIYTYTYVCISTCVYVCVTFITIWYVFLFVCCFACYSYCFWFPFFLKVSGSIQCIDYIYFRLFVCLLGFIVLFLGKIIFSPHLNKEFHKWVWSSK